jgi:predicted transcriptional regulator
MTLIITPTKQAYTKELAELGFVHRDIACHLGISEATISYNLKTISTMADAYQRAPVSGHPRKLND